MIQYRFGVHWSGEHAALEWPVPQRENPLNGVDELRVRGNVIVPDVSFIRTVKADVDVRPPPGKPRDWLGSTGTEFPAKALVGVEPEVRLEITEQTAHERLHLEWHGHVYVIVPRDKAMVAPRAQQGASVNEVRDRTICHRFVKRVHGLENDVQVLAIYHHFE